MKRLNWHPGNIVEIRLSDNSYAYGIVIKFPLIGFFSYNSMDQIKDVNQLVYNTILFKVWVMKYAISKKYWKVIGHMELNEEIGRIPSFYKHDPVSGRYSIYKYENGIDKSYPCDVSEARLLECAAVWDPEHVQDRLLDTFNNRTCKWVDNI